MTFRLFVNILVVIFLASACAPKPELDADQKKIDELQAKVATLESRIVAFQYQVSELQSQLATSKSESAQLKSQLEKKPKLPVTVSFRKALLGEGYVAVFNTTVKSPVPILATYQSKALGISKKFELHINPSVATEIGYAEGAVFTEGDTITLENKNYSPTVVNVEIK